MDSEIAKAWFERLEELLKDRKLPCEHSPARVCDVGEFMLMQQIGEVGQFKHRSSRNYVMVKKADSSIGLFDVPSPNGYELVVPFTTTGFHLGFFDNA